MGWETPEDWEEQEAFESASDLRGRMFFMRLTIVVVLGVLLGRVIWLQQTKGEEFVALADDNRSATLTNNAPRGVIFDRNGVLLAENNASFNVSITPSKLPRDAATRDAVFERLSMLTGVPVTNTVQQQALVDEADPETIGRVQQLAELYGAPITDTLDAAGIVDQLPTSIEDVVQTFSFDPFNPHVITSNVSITLARIIEQESVFLPGVSVVAEPLRNYPTGEETAHIIGFMGPIPDISYVTELGYERDDRVGLFGLESSMEPLLAGVKGERQIEVDSTGREVRQLSATVDPTPGYNLHLTLDYELQLAASEALQRAMQALRERLERTRPDNTEIEQAVVVAINPKNGEVLAMVNVPSFDNNRFATEIPVEYYLSLVRNDYQPLLNKAIGGQYPPGSVFKIVTAAAALQEGIVSPSRLLDTPGSIVIPNRFAPDDPGRAQRFVCWIWNQFVRNEETGEIERGEHGAMNMYTGMANSCDIYFYKIAGGFDQDNEYVEPLGIERLRLYANQFGMGVQQGIELPAEAPGNIPSQAWKQSIYAEPWSTGDDYNTAIGQGYVLSTPLQIAQMAAVIANGGFLYRPAIVHHLTDAQGRIIVLDDEENAYAVVFDADGRPQLEDSSGRLLDPAARGITLTFDEEGNYVRPPELINAVDVDRANVEVIAESLRLVNTIGTGRVVGEPFRNEDGTFEIVPWLDTWGIATAGKSGTAEYCDNIALERGWCYFATEGGPRQIQPTHAWYLAYAPLEDPEIVVAAFIFNGDEGSIDAAPIVYDVLRAYFQVGDFAPDAAAP